MIKRGDLYIHMLILLFSLYLLLLHVPFWDRESKRDVLPILNDSLVDGRDLHHASWMEGLATTVSPLIYGQITSRAAVAACHSVPGLLGSDTVALLFHEGDGTLLRRIVLDGTVTRCPGEPAGQRSCLQVVVPGIGEIWLGLDQLLVDQILPVGGDLLCPGVIEGDFPGLAIDVERARACLPCQSGEPSWLLGWEVGHVHTGIGGMQLRCRISVLGPGGGHWDIIL